MTSADILAALTSLGISQATVAKRLGVSRRTVTRWVSGEREAPPYLADAIEHMSCVPRRMRSASA